MFYQFTCNAQIIEPRHLIKSTKNQSIAVSSGGFDVVVFESGRLLVGAGDVAQVFNVQGDEHREGQVIDQ